MRIALLALHFAEYSLRLAEALASRHDVLLVLEHADALGYLGVIPTTALPSLSIRTIRRRRSVAGIFANRRELLALVLDFSPDVIHLQEAIFDFVALAAFSVRGLPLALTVHDPVPHSGEEARSLRLLKHSLAQHFLRSLCDIAFVHGSALELTLTKAYPRLRGRIFPVCHGPIGGPPVTYDAEPGCLLFFGRIKKYKGIGQFIEAVRALHASGVGVRGVIAGSGEDLEGYRGLIEGHPAFELHEGFVHPEELPHLFGRAQAVVLPYIDGTQSGVAAMALGYGRPVVTTRVGALQEMVRDGENGWLVPPNDVGSLVAALMRVIEDPESTRQMGRRSFALGQTDLSWARNAEIATDAYQTAIRRKRLHT